MFVPSLAWQIVWEPTWISSHWNHMVGYASALYCRFAGSGSLWVRTSLNADRNKRYETNLSAVQQQQSETKREHF